MAAEYTAIFVQEEKKMTNYYNMENENLISLEASLDYRDPDLCEEIMSRAEEFEPGITQLYLDSFSSSTLSSDEIFARAVSYLK